MNKSSPPLLVLYPVTPLYNAIFRNEIALYVPDTDECLKQSTDAGHHDGRGQQVRLGRVLRQNAQFRRQWVDHENYTADGRHHVLRTKKKNIIKN